ncbi:hypothetical protein [Streptomyces sp. CC228A]|uniref:hypothetical protein n=1 Tax=Streptomyces sp. CC228A TaxID=2898186 RepID=UPI001F4651F3|nr:hypothetical protein [Streptomyces sp. CC228A]
MRTARKAAAAAAGAAALLAMSVTGAQAADTRQAEPAAAPAKALNTQVHAWLRANVRESPNTSGAILSYVSPGYTYSAICWTYGEKVTLEGYTSSKWVLIDRPWPKKNGYVTAIALSGDSTGGVPNRC